MDTGELSAGVWHQKRGEDCACVYWDGRRTPRNQTPPFFCPLVSLGVVMVTVNHQGTGGGDI